MSDSAAFRPFETLIAESEALRHLRDAVAGADDGELFLERRRSEVLGFDDGRLRTSTYDSAEGFGLRAVRGETAGYAHASEISEAAIARAVGTARLAVGQGGGNLAAPPAKTNAKLYGDADPMDGVSFAHRIGILQEIDAFARGLDPRIIQVTPRLPPPCKRSRSCDPKAKSPAISARCHG